MIQVDFFWSYAIGATFALAAARQISKEDCKWYESKFFTFTVFYLAVFFAPSGIYLLWQHLSWETMQVWNRHSDLPAIFVVIFAVTNVTDGILAYYICHKFIKKGNYFAAATQVLLGYFIMFFILVHGWDGTGWQRFTYDTALHNGELWAPGKTDGLLFFISPVAIALYVMGVLILPPMFYFFYKWLKEGLEADDSVPNDKIPSFLKISTLMLAAVFGIALGTVIGATFVCMFFTFITGGNQIIGGYEFSILGIVIGIPVFLIPMWYFVFRRDKLAYKFFKLIFIEEPIEK
ncbi:MAG: hypothetical protein ACTSVV_02385 [Promethearchaeota archaeon]